MGIIKCENRKCAYFDEGKLDNCSHSFVEIRLCENSIVKGVKFEKYKNPYLNALMSNECVCGGEKKLRQSFCYKCFKKLPRDLKNDLYSHMGDGYEEAYDASVKFLEESD